MKKIMISVIAIILIISLAFLGKEAFAGTCWSGEWCGYDEGEQFSEILDESTGTVLLNSHHITFHNDNVYCVQYGQKMASQGTYMRTATAVIEGDYATLYEYDIYNNKIEETDEPIYNENNNILAALLSTANLETGYAQWNEDNLSYGSRSDLQIGVWHFWYDWVLSLPGEDWETAFPAYYNAGGAEKYAPNGGADAIMNYVKALADTHEYKVTIHYLRNSKWIGQNYILIERGTPSTEITVNKVWDDNDNAGRPSSVTVKISGYPDNNTNNTKIEKTVVLNENNNWTATVEMPAKSGSNTLIKYTVEEVEAGGYTSQIQVAMKNVSISTDSSGNTDYASAKVVTKNVENGEIDWNATVTITNTLNGIDIPVKKTWSDNSNQDGKRPASITVTLYADGTSTGKTKILNASNNWQATFTGVPEYKDGKTITYTIKERSVPSGYTATEGNSSNSYTITNTHTPEKIDIPVQKVWDDDNNRDGKRTSSITVTLYKNGVSTGKTKTLNASNSWKATFTNLDKYQSGKLITYTIKENTVPSGYMATEGNSSNNYTITNTHTPETIKIPVTKIWEDDNDSYGHRPTSIKVTLKYANGNKVTTDASGRAITNPVTLNVGNGWKYEFTNLNKYESGQEIQYKIEETAVDNYLDPVITGNQNTGYTITNTHKPAGYIEISGKVWIDRPDGKANKVNGKLDSDESGLGGIKVTLRDAQGKQFDATSTATTAKDGTYTIKVNYDNSKNVYKLYEDATTVRTKLNTAYVEFEYDGMKYTTVATATSGADTSKAKENETTRNKLDSAHSTTTSSTSHPDNWTDKNITAITKNVISFENYSHKTTIEREEVLKYCNGNGTYIYTNPEAAWKDIKSGKGGESCTSGKGHAITTYDIEVQQIQNVNLGLFEREQPDVAIFSDLSKVEVEMQGQRYTYLYNVRSSKLEAEDGLKVKFQNKDTYTYRRPINPADIAYIQEEANQNGMSVKVTYQVKVGNLSSTLPITVHNITNYFDTEYTLNTTGWKITSGEQFNQATYNGDLNITVAPLSESDAIELTFSVSLDAIKALLNEDATLNNAVEITSYSTMYGDKTLYAEQKTGGRTNKPYAGYDYDSHPGNAGIFINNEGRLEATKLEDDTDIAPSFVLCKDPESKILSGTVWEDSDADNGSGPDNFRVGDGKLTDADGNKKVANVKVELLKVKADGTTEPAYLYNKNKTEKILAITYTNSDGYYAFGNDEYSVVTDVYMIKFTYGDAVEKDGSTVVSTIGDTQVNGRNYKSTIISQENINVYNLFKGTSTSEEWHLNTTKGYSIAVDDVEQRVNVSDLQYSNFNDPINIVAYSKPFKMQVEYNPIETKESSVVDENGETTFGKELNVFDFGIIERSREDIFVETKVDYLKITLANGQVLTEGNPNEEMNYVKPVGLNQDIQSGANARNALEKQILMEMDAELIQGAQLEVRYAIQVTNNSEKDYDYYVEDTGKLNTEFYYFGTNSEKAPETEGSVNYVVDYLDAELICNWENAVGWEQVTADDLRQEGNEQISKTTYDAIKSGKYVAYATTKFSNLKPGQTSETDYITASKVLANQDENVYDNHAEILQVDSETARTLKQYKSGNYVPSLETRKISTDINLEQAGLHEQDDDRIKIVITPPTGAANYIITYVIATLVGLIVMVVGVVFIKKKVLTK